MANFEDGCYNSVTGIDLIAKVLAGRCKMRYTRAAVGKGHIPEGQSPKTMTGPPEYVMDAMIAAITNPLDGECQLTVQISNSDVETGFYLTSIVLFAEDPDLGEVPYTYLYLENYPEWIRPASSAIGKFSEFDLVAAVGDVDTVSAHIDPESIVTRQTVQQIVDSATLKRSIVIPADGWVSDVNGYHIDIEQEDITSNMVANVTLMEDSKAIARKCDMSSTSETLDGAVRLRADKQPTGDMNATLLIHKASDAKAQDNGGGNGGSGGNSGGNGGGGSSIPEDAFVPDDVFTDILDDILGKQ